MLLHQASYHPFGPVAGWSYGNGRQMTRSLDQDYRPLAVQDTTTGGLSLNFSFDSVGNLTQLTRGSPPPLTFVYDPLGRLTETRDGPTQVAIDIYGYDKTGNRTVHTTAAGTSAYGYPTTSHRLTDVGGIIRAYDEAGNTLNIGAAKEFVYSAANRMSQVKQAGVVAMNYAYNGRGEQVRKHVGSSNTYTLYDEVGHWLGDYDSTGAPLQQALWMDDLPVGLLANGHQLHYLEPDHLGTPRVVIEVARDVPVWTWDVKGEAFGNTAPDQNPDGDANAFVLDMRFPGQRYDAASGLNQNGFRAYEATTGRYPTSDPLGLGGGISTYAYVKGAPLTSTDPLGLQTTVDTWCRQHPVECAAIFGGSALIVTPKPQTITWPETSSGEKCKTRTEVYPGYDECSEIARYYPYASASQSLLDFPTGSKKRPGTPATGGLCAMKGTHHTVFLNGAYVGSILSCRCCTNTGGGPVIEERWGNNVGR